MFVSPSLIQVNKMLRWRLSDEPVAEQEKDVDGNVDLEARKQVAAPSAPHVITASLRVNL